MNFGKYLKRTDFDFVVFIDIDVLGSGYNVVSKDIDKYNAHDLADVQEYARNNPAMEVKEIDGFYV